MSTIKRYDFEWIGESKAGMVEASLGDYVDYTDHLAAVEAAVMAERTACAAACGQLSTEFWEVFTDQAVHPTLQPHDVVTESLSYGASRCADALRARTTNQAKEAE